jgi:hypothetical protein
MAPTVAPEPCQERRGLDFATAMFFSGSPRHQQEVFDFCIDLSEGISSSVGWQSKGGSRHFERVFQSDLGMRIELSPPDHPRTSNRGLLKLDLPGAFFYLQSAEQAVVQLQRLVNRDGFKHFTRLDFMNTEVEPEWPVDRVHAAVVDRSVWVKGYGSCRHWGQEDFAGRCEDGRTIYWGSTRAERQGRTYDKARQLGWRRPAIRDEVQLRGGWAKGYTAPLVGALNGNLTGEAMNTAVNELTVSALRQHLEYWTLNGADPQADKNWQRKAEPADWFDRRIGRANAGVRKVPVEPLVEDAAFAHCVMASGPTLGGWLLDQALDPEVGMMRGLMRLGGRLLCRVKPQELLRRLDDLPPERQQELVAQFQELVNACALEEEHRAEADE